jgi:hypothetical protein
VAAVPSGLSLTPSEKKSILMCSRNRDSSVGIATGWTTEGSEFKSLYGKEFSPRRPDRLWGPPSLLYNWYCGFFPQG